MVRLASVDDSLVLLLPFKNVMYDYTYLNIQGCKYYVMDKAAAGKPILLTDFSTPKERMFSLRITGAMNLGERPGKPRVYTSKRYPALSFPVSVNENLIDFYNDYPLSGEWGVYSEASLSEEVKGQLYPALLDKIAGKDLLTAANMLLNFVQTAFEYKTDVEQFGRERAFLVTRPSSTLTATVRTGRFCIPSLFVNCWGWMWCCCIIRFILRQPSASNRLRQGITL